GGVGDLAEGEGPAGDAGHVDAALLDPHVPGAALQELRGDPGGLVADLACGPQDGGAGVGGDAAAPGSHAEGMDLGVPRDDHHVLEADPERVGGDLGQGGRVTLALSGDSDVDEDLAARIDPDGGALVGADARALRVAGDADT